MIIAILYENFFAVILYGYVPAMVTGTMEAKTVNAQESIYQGMEQRLLRYWHLIHQRQMGMTA